MFLVPLAKSFFGRAAPVGYHCAMQAASVYPWLQVAESALRITAILIGGFWVWSRFVLERGLLPPSQMNISLRTLGSSESGVLIEVAVSIQNQGTSALVVSDLRVRLGYLNQNDTIRIIDDTGSDAYGRLSFPHTHDPGRRDDPDRARVQQDRGSLRRGEFRIVPYDTFVQPGVEQIYTFVTALPATAAYVLARASFRYELKPGRCSSGSCA